MTKIDIYSGFLGAGKTTLIKKLLTEGMQDEQVILIENEFGEIGIDGGFLKDAGVEIKEMSQGCICCSLVGDFGTSLKEVMSTYSPDRILIEPSGVGKLSDVMKAVKNAIDEHEVILNAAVAVVDASKARMYVKNFGEFFINQIEHAGTVVLSRTQNISPEKLAQAVEIVRKYNEKATIITTPWDDLDGKDIIATIEGAKDLEKELLAEIEIEHEHHHDDDDDCDCPACRAKHEHDHDHEHEHHHDHDCCDHDHEHEHHHDHDCCDHDHEHEHEHHHHHDHEGHHHADDVFTSWGLETPKTYSKEEIENILEELDDSKTYGMILRAKGMVPATDGGWIYFDYVPGESNVRDGKPDVTGKFCVIGSKINEHALEELFK